LSDIDSITGDAGNLDPTTQYDVNHPRGLPDNAAACPETFGTHLGIGRPLEMGPAIKRDTPLGIRDEMKLPSNGNLCTRNRPAFSTPDQYSGLTALPGHTHRSTAPTISGLSLIDDQGNKDIEKKDSYVPAEHTSPF
ncbi:MAG TPA: hypothetical protein VE398_05960, partial [Acidobacteriota bacterium]|nr:hypothetical protein [Acidobacteriota bacterium]